MLGIATVSTVRRFLDPEIRSDLILQSQLPGPSFGWVVLPKTTVRDAKRRILLSLVIYSLWEVSHRQMRPVVILVALGTSDRQFLPPFLWILPLGL